MNLLFEAHFIWWDIYLSLDATVQPQYGMPDFVDAQGSPCLRTGWGGKWKMGWRGVEGGEGRELEKNIFKLKKYI